MESDAFGYTPLMNATHCFPEQPANNDDNETDSTSETEKESLQHQQMVQALLNARANKKSKK